MNSAIGIVIAMLNVPHGEFASALTTTSARTASRMTMIDEHGDQRGDAADRADLVARHLARGSCRRGACEKNRTTMSCTAPAKMTPTMIQIVPGR